VKFDRLEWLSALKKLDSCEEYQRLYSMQFRMWGCCVKCARLEDSGNVKVYKY
jgi:hypothetical protein